MSWVANILVSVRMSEDFSLVEEFSTWLETQAPRRENPGAQGVGSLLPLHDSPEAWGGWKSPEASLWGGVLNHADLPAVVEHFGQVPWRCPDVAQLMIMDQEQGAFRLWMIRDGRVRQFAPLPDAGEDRED